jgi:superfamily II DNA helicase RecQ
MQLEFFGETFDPHKCGRTCDNCRASREPERRDLTEEAKTIIELLSDVLKQRKIGVTMLQLTELYRGSKAQSATKFIDTNRLRGYGKGSKYKKPEVDRIFHSLVFERVLVEKSVQNKSGFSNDYIENGENAFAVQNGQRRFFVNFPKTTKKSSSTSREGTSREQQTSATERSGKKSPKAATAKKKRPMGLDKKGKGQGQRKIVLDDSDSDTDDGLLETSALSAVPGNKTKNRPPLLPGGATLDLTKAIKEMAISCAEEERLNGRKVFYWNIVSQAAIKSIASQVPMSLEELKGLGVLGENIVKLYGGRIVKIIRDFVEQNSLGDSVSNRPSPPKRHKTNDIVDMTQFGEDDDDQFDAGDIDFSAIVLPGDNPTAAKESNSHYFHSS